MKTQRELNQKYWNEIHDMLEAYNKEHSVDVKPWECVKKRIVKLTHHHLFNDSPEVYQFAVAILFDEQAGIHKPIFPGDTVYIIDGGRSLTVRDDTQECITSKYWSWHKPQPKRTFEINGVEFNSPVTGGCRTVHPIHFGDSLFFFNTHEDVNDLEQFIEKLLIQARDK